MHDDSQSVFVYFSFSLNNLSRDIFELELMNISMESDTVETTIVITSSASLSFNVVTFNRKRAATGRTTGFQISWKIPRFLSST